jgi:hypothetical protein
LTLNCHYLGFKKSAKISPKIAENIDLSIGPRTPTKFAKKTFSAKKKKFVRSEKKFTCQLCCVFFAQTFFPVFSEIYIFSFHRVIHKPRKQPLLPLKALGKPTAYLPCSVTRLGEFPPIGRSFTSGSFFENFRNRPRFWATFFP